MEPGEPVDPRDPLVIAFTHPVGVIGEWWYVDPAVSVGRLTAIETAVYRWRLDVIRALIIERLKEWE